MKRQCKTIGKRIARFRRQRGFTQDELLIGLRVLGSNLTREMLSEIESGHRGATDLEICFLSEVLSIPIGKLVSSLRPWPGKKRN